MSTDLPESRAVAMRPTLATSREVFAAAVVFVVVGYIVILPHGWQLTGIDRVSAIVALGGLSDRVFCGDRRARALRPGVRGR